MISYINFRFPCAVVAPSCPTSLCPTFPLPLYLSLLLSLFITLSSFHRISTLQALVWFMRYLHLICTETIPFLWQLFVSALQLWQKDSPSRHPSGYPVRAATEAVKEIAIAKISSCWHDKFHITQRIQTV